MKKVIFSAFVLCALCVSCAKEMESPAVPAAGEKMVEVTFTAGVATKTHLDSDGQSVIWQTGDRISVFANGNNYEFTLASGHNTSVGVFNGTMTDVDAAAGEFFALYPYNASASISDGVISTPGIGNNINYNQHGSFPNNSVQSVARCGEDMKFDFKLVCALMKVTVPESMSKLLKELMISSNAGATTESFIGGTVAITVADEPVAAVSGGKADIMVQNASGLEAATYYFPVYPTSISKGLRIKMSYVDGRSAEYLFSGKTFTLERARIFNVGTVRPQPSYVFENFEDYDVMSSGATKVGAASYISGNNGALSIVANPFKTAVNGSEKVLYNDMHTATWQTSGYIQMDLTGNTAKEKFPFAARDKFKGVRFKMYIAGSEYFPHFRYDASGSKGSKNASSINGTSTSGMSEDQMADLILHDEWNVFEFNLSAAGYSVSNFSGMDKFQIRCFTTFSDGNCAAALSDTNLKYCYFDDLEFIY